MQVRAEQMPNEGKLKTTNRLFKTHSNLTAVLDFHENAFNKRALIAVLIAAVPLFDSIELQCNVIICVSIGDILPFFNDLGFIRQNCVSVICQLIKAFFSITPSCTCPTPSQAYTTAPPLLRLLGWIFSLRLPIIH